MERSNTVHRLVHLDLKSCPLKLDYLRKVLRVFREWGATSILIEWEDTFPYNGKLVEIGSLAPKKSAYSVKEVEQILSYCAEYCLSVIPLIQTIGHLEFVLKYPKWKHIREVPKYESCLCPLHQDSFLLVSEMITQLLNLHPNIEFLHIGGDEVWHMRRCDKCRFRDKSHLYLEYMVRVLEYLKTGWPHIQVIMWDDMMRSMNKDLLQMYNIGALVEPMIWHYHRAEKFSLHQDMWNSYEGVFKNIWIASAYKGATGSCQILPIIEHHISNNEKWLEVVPQISSKFNIRGIALTGWSRYNHYAALCELLPTALNSLAVCLHLWWQGNFDEHGFTLVSSMLGYTASSPMPLNPYASLDCIPQSLRFPGHRVCETMHYFAKLRSEFNSVAYSDEAVTWMNSWQIKHNHTSVAHVERILYELKQLYRKLNSVTEVFVLYLPKVYYQVTIDEWLGTYMHPLTDKLRELIKNGETQLSLRNS